MGLSRRGVLCYCSVGGETKGDEMGSNGKTKGEHCV